MFGVVDCFTGELSFSKRDFGVSPLLKSHAFRKKWCDSSNVLTISAGPLAGFVKGFDSAYCVNKSPFTGKLSVSELPSFGVSLARAGLSGLCFERKSEKPIILVVSDDGVNVLELSEGLVNNLWLKGGHAAVKYFVSKQFQNHSVLTASLASHSVFGNVKCSSGFSGSGGVGSVLFNAHGVAGIALPKNREVEFLDNNLVESVRSNYDFVSGGLSDWELLFNGKYESLPQRVFWNAEPGVKELGLRLGVFDDFLAGKLYNRIVSKGFDLFEVSNLLSGVLHAVHSGVFHKEVFSKEFDVNFNFSDFRSNPYFYSNEHFNLSSELLESFLNEYNLSRKELFSLFSDSFGSRALDFFKPVQKADLVQALAGFNSSLPWNPEFAGKLVALKNGKSRDFVKESKRLNKKIRRFNFFSGI